MKNTRYRAGTFIEIDDLSGGRKIVMVCKDGSTYWDTLNAHESTPIIIHDCLNPLAIGSMSEFLETSGLQGMVADILRTLRGKIGDRVDEDPLFLMRVLWHSSKLSSGKPKQDAKAITITALDKAQSEHDKAVSVQKHIEKYYSAHG